MRYTFLSAHAVQGIAHPLGAADMPLFDDPTKEVRVFLTSDAVGRLYLLNRHLALMSMMLRALVGDPLADDFPDVLAAETAKVARQRSDSIGSDPVVIIEITGEVEATVPANARELEDFIVCFDAYDKKAIRARLASQVSAVLTALRIGAGNPLEFRQVSEGSYLTTPDGRVVHSASVEAGSLGASVSHRLSEEQRQRIQADVRLTLDAGSLERVMRLHAQSLSKATDNYRGFIAAWSALEILVGKLFPTYHHLLATDLRTLRPSPGLHAYLDRIADVMADKYNLADKFAVLSVYLDDTFSEEEVQTFRKLKGVRDRISHGEEVDEAALPTRDIQRLFDKYLRNHLRRDS
jgi:hypothetical protein